MKCIIDVVPWYHLRAFKLHHQLLELIYEKKEIKEHQI